MNIIIIIAD